MMDKVKVFFVEDEMSLGMIVRDSLESRGFDVCFFSEGKEAFDSVFLHEYDIYVLDVMLPQVDGFTIAREIRKHNKSIPILFLTAKSQPENVVEGFEIGGNDYLKKPFSIEELIIRIKALVGRLDFDRKVGSKCKLGNYIFDRELQTLSISGKEKELTHRESEILKMLYENRNHILERKLVLSELWGDDNFFNARSMDVFIARLRKYLSEDSSVKIVNIRGVGYKLIV
ncbi:MAG: response regulator transcription factor [Bacteroidales bacterium]